MPCMCNCLIAGGERFPFDLDEGRNADAEEILAALKEVLSLGGTEHLTPSQTRYRKILPMACESRVSQFFLDQHPELMTD